MARIGDGFDLIAASDWSTPKTIIVGSDEMPTSQPTISLPDLVNNTSTQKETGNQQETMLPQLSMEQIGIVGLVVTVVVLAVGLLLVDVDYPLLSIHPQLRRLGFRQFNGELCPLALFAFKADAALHRFN
ncbi:MAG: hypothetical protein ACM3UY_10455 [Methanocella sp.]